MPRTQQEERTEKEITVKGGNSQRSRRSCERDAHSDKFANYMLNALEHKEEKRRYRRMNRREATRFAFPPLIQLEMRAEPFTHLLLCLSLYRATQWNDGRIISTLLAIQRQEREKRPSAFRNVSYHFVCYCAENVAGIVRQTYFRNFNRLCRWWKTFQMR